MRGCKTGVMLRGAGKKRFSIFAFSFSKLCQNPILHSNYPHFGLKMILHVFSLRGGGKPKFFFRAKFEIFVYLEKTQKSKIFETNLRVIGLSGAPRRPKIRKCQIWSKIEKKANFQHFSKIPKTCE